MRAVTRRDWAVGEEEESVSVKMGRRVVSVCASSCGRVSELDMVDLGSLARRGGHQLVTRDDVKQG